MALDNINGYAVDKAKFYMELTPDEYAARSDAWHQVFGGTEGPQGGKTYNIVSVKKGERHGAFYYMFDVWGEAAALVDNLDFVAWYSFLSRVDLKLPMPMTVDGRDNYYQYAKEKIGNKRSMGFNDSPRRQKRGDRDAGGNTLHLGSHKSDFRVHWTMRGQEDGYQEFQLSGSRLAPVLFSQAFYIREQGEWVKKTGWEPMMQALLVSANLELSDLDGLYDSERASLLAGELDHHGVIARKLDYVEYQLEKLPTSALYALLDALNERLFGTPVDNPRIDPEASVNDTLLQEE